MRNIRVGMLFAAFLLFVLTACGPASNEKESQSSSNGSKAEHAVSVAKANWHVSDFQFTDQNGNPFGLSNLKGKVWVADMIFTHCKSICPVTTAHMAKLQSMLNDNGLSIPLVSFSVDPGADKPGVLKAYGKRFSADFSTWHFLTGYTPEEIKQFSLSSFKSPVSRNGDTDQFTHSSSFFLVNQSGKVMARYDGIQPPYDEIIKDVKQLKKSNGASIVTKSDSTIASDAMQKPLKVDIQFDPSVVKAGQPVTIKTVITVGGIKRNSSSNVMVAISKADEDPMADGSQMMAKNQGKGIYTVKKTFDKPGTYAVMVMVAVNGQSTMPTKQIVVK
ncbi:MAG TPA: SCO family protein [Bacillales bacterium]|nr:SCO family protein [Bacillales bacterium]